MLSPAVPTTTHDLAIRTDGVHAAARAELARTQGLLRLAPCWVPRSFLQPGLRIKLHPDDTYAYGLHRGGIDERWFGSTTDAANDNRTPDEGLSYCVVGRERFTLKQAVAELGADIVGDAIWSKYRKWPVYAKFFDNMGPLPHHMHQDDAQAALVGQEGKPEAYYFPPQHNPVGNNFPHTFMGLVPGTTKSDVRRCLEQWNNGDNGILDISQAYRLKVGSGWIMEPRVLHAPGSLCTYEPQWGSDVFAMYQSLVEGRMVPWELLVKDMPSGKHRDLDFIVEQLDWEKNVDPNFKANHYLEPVTAAQGAGWYDRWIIYGKMNGFEYFTAKELTVEPGATATVADNGAYGLTCVQGTGTINGEPLSSPRLIRFRELTNDEYFCTAGGARRGVVFTNTSTTEPLVCLRYFGPEVHPNAPSVGAHLSQGSV